MTDKVQKIREEVERLRKSYQIMYQELDCESSELMSVCAKRNLCQDILMFIDSVQEEPKQKMSVEEAMTYIDNKSKAFTEAHKGGSADEILSEMRGEEPVNEDLEEEIERYLKESLAVKFSTTDIKSIQADVRYTARHFAEWQKQQFEKNRLKHCNSITNEQAELEQGFIDQHLDNYQRMPTFLDAIEYGMRLQKQQMIDKACKWLDENIEKYISADGEWDIDWCIMNDFRKSLEE